MGFLSSTAYKRHRNHSAYNHPFMTCIVKVDTQSQWQRTVRRVLAKCYGVHTFRMDDNGVVEISGTVDPGLLLKMMGRAGRSAELCWFQFGECSSNLFMPTNNGGGGSGSYTCDGRFLHATNISRPMLPSQQALTNQNYDYEYDHDSHSHHYSSYGYNQAYPQSYHHRCYDDSLQYYYDDQQYQYQYNNGGNTIRDRAVQQYRRSSGEDVGCCSIM